MDDMSNIPVQDAVIVDETVPAQTPAVDQNQADILINLGELIKSHMQSLDRLRNELKEQKQMLEDVFVNSEAYRDHAEKAKEALKVKSQTRQQIMQQPAVAMISQKIKGISMEIKEKKTAMSDYLLEYQRMAGVNEVEGYDGEVREIVNEAKLVKRVSKGH